MKRFFQTLFHALLACLCIAPVYVLVACVGIKNVSWCFQTLGVCCLLAFVFSFLPGSIGNRRKEVTVIAPASSRIGGDPNPDREKPVEEVHMKGISVPVRFPITLLFSLAAAGAQFFYIGSISEATLAPVLLACLLTFIGIELLVFDLVSHDPIFIGVRGTTVGIVLYAVSAIACYFVKDAQMNTILVSLVCAFLILTGFTLNDSSLSTGVSGMKKMKPSKTIVRRNRVILVIFGCITAFVAFFRKIKEAVDTAMWAAVHGFGRLIHWLMNLFPKSESATESAQEAAEGGLGGLPAGESSPFWEFMEKIAIALCVIICIALIYILLRVIWRKLYILLRRIMARLRMFANSMSEEYEDETQSLFDMEDMKESVREAFQSRFGKLFNRGKKWDAMTAVEKARHIVKRLYQKSGSCVNRLFSRTVREALSEMPCGTADKESIIALYEQARYQEQSPDEAKLEQLRKAAGV